MSKLFEKHFRRRGLKFSNIPVDQCFCVNYDKLFKVNLCIYLAFESKNKYSDNINITIFEVPCLLRPTLMKGLKRTDDEYGTSPSCSNQRMPYLMKSG